jgi:DNA-binding SARP family transcriptional activator
VSNPVVLTEKLRRPEPAGLARTRLESRLLEGATNRLHLVVAPPGSGKTTLLARVAAAAALSAPVAWYRLTGDDATEGAVVAHLARALHDNLGIAVAGPSMAGLLEALEDWPGKSGTVVLDDVHEIAGTTAEHALEQFVQLRPHALRVLIGSRRQPEMNIPRLRVSDVLQEISSDDLRFRSWEVEELFTAVFHEPLSPESAAALTRRTGGWAAGLQLFHLSTAGRSAADRRRAVDDLGGRSKLVRSYLARNVLAELPEERRQFLLRTCTLGSLTGALCDALLETTGSRRILDELEQQQLFTSSADDGETFRYHEVLRAHLEWALIEEYGAAGARRWYSRSAALLESIGEARSAVRAYARAEDWGAVARMIQTRGSGPDSTVAGTDFLLPATVVEHDPWLSLAEARRRVREGALGAAIQAYRQAEALLDEPDFRESCRHERTAAALWAAPSAGERGWTSPPPTDTRHWSARVRAATRRSTQLPTGRADCGERLGRGVSALLAGEFSRARTLLDSVEQDADADTTLRLLAGLAGTAVDLLTVGCEDPSARLGQIALDAEIAGLPWVARLARGLGETVLVAMGSPAWRVAACAHLLIECERAGDDWGAALLQLATAIACQLADPAGPADRFADAAERFRQLDAPVPALWSQALQACVLARQAVPGAGELAHLVATGARAVQLSGAHALALAALAVAAGGEHRPVHMVIGDAANSEGVRAAIPLLTGAVTGRALARSEIPPQKGATPAPESTTATAADADRPVDIAPSVRSGMRVVRLNCFGGFAMEIDGEQVDFGPLRPRARALLRLLALSPGRDMHREHLVDALWPGVDLTIGTRRLQVAVSSVRQLLEHCGLSGQDILLRRGDAYRLTLPAGSSVDVRDFEAALREAALAVKRGDTLAAITHRQAALSLYRGDVLPEDGPAEYVVGERERLRLAASSAAAALAQESRRVGQPGQAMAAARQSLQLDRFQDLAWQLLVELHEESGDSSAAAHARREHAQARAELGVAIR